jgi:SNF2 family DNA or RNA helicase
MGANVQKCPWCGKVARMDVTKPPSNVFGKTFNYLECGHTILADQLGVTAEGFKKSEFAEMVSRDGRKPYPFQAETADFALQANLNYICGHEMGLGKTVIECLLLKRHLEELKPVLIACKSGLRRQWWLEIFRWSDGDIIPDIIENSRQVPDFSLHDVFIISFDTLRLIRPVKGVLDDEEDELLGEDEQDNMLILNGLAGKKRKSSRAKRWSDEVCRQFKHICIDETQQIKNPTSARTKSLQDIVKQTRSDSEGNPKTPARIAGYSGTNIKNRPSEFWTMLNMVEPTMFPYYETFCRNEIRYDYTTGKETGLRDAERFHEKISRFFIRYTREEKLPELPKVNRMFKQADMDGNFIEVYKRTVKEFQEFMDIKERSASATDLLGYYSRMRHITGMAKVNMAVEEVEEFLLSTNRKIVLFVHHKEVGKALLEKLSRLMKEGAWEAPLALTSDMDMNARHQALEDFKKPENRVLIASQLAAGEGLNMQFCSDCIMVERQWNPANEIQCEARFTRPGSEASVVNVWYLIADGTIDEFLTELVEKKRAVLLQVLDKEESDWQNSDLFRELAEVIRIKGLRKFKDAGKK